MNAGLWCTKMFHCQENGKDGKKKNRDDNPTDKDILKETATSVEMTVVDHMRSAHEKSKNSTIEEKSPKWGPQT